MKTHSIIYKHTGEVSYTAPTPHDIDEGQYDLEETKTALLSNDDWRGVQVKKYTAHEVTLPDWLSPHEWLTTHVYIGFDYAWRLGMDPNWPEHWQRFVVSIEDEGRQLAMIKLLKVKNFRSDFRRSLRQQVENWLNTSPLDRNHQSPLSPRQWQCLVDRRTAREASDRCSAIYRARSRHGGCEPWVE